jgi:hypothetical protein
MINCVNPTHFKHLFGNFLNYKIKIRKIYKVQSFPQKNLCSAVVSCRKCYLFPTSVIELKNKLRRILEKFYVGGEQICLGIFFLDLWKCYWLIRWNISAFLNQNFPITSHHCPKLSFSNCHYFNWSEFWTVMSLCFSTRFLQTFDSFTKLEIFHNKILLRHCFH